MSELPSQEGLAGEPALSKRERREKEYQELLRRREAGELDQNDFEIVHLHYLVESGQPVTRKDIGNKAIVITQVEFLELGGFEIVSSKGEVIYLDPESFSSNLDDKLVIFPDDLGESVSSPP